MTDPNNIGQYLRSARAKANLTRPKTAEALGVHANTLKTWESDTAAIPLSQAIRLADLYGVSIGELVGDQEHFAVLDTMRELTRQIQEVRWAVDDLKRGAADQGSA